MLQCHIENKLTDVGYTKSQYGYVVLSITKCEVKLLMQLYLYNCWSLGIVKQFLPTLYYACNYLSMLGLKINNVSKRGPCGFQAPTKLKAFGEIDISDQSVKSKALILSNKSYSKTCLYIYIYVYICLYFRQYMTSILQKTYKHTITT